MPAMEQKERMNFTLEREVKKRNISAKILQNSMGLRQAHLGETQLPACLNFTCKSKTIISVKTIKCNTEIPTQRLQINSDAHGVSFYL